jgi:hypothetical protein
MKGITEKQLGIKNGKKIAKECSYHRESHR